MSSLSISLQCEQDIQRRILRGELAPGSKLMNSELARHYQVAISPIREALARLSQARLVQFIDKKGFYVSSISEADLIDVSETYAMLESLALKKAIQKGDDAWENAIVSSLYQLAKVEKGQKVPYEQWAQCNQAFHSALISGCASPALLSCRALVYQAHQRYINLSFYYANESTLQANHVEHQAIAEATLNKDSVQAVQRLKAHILDGQLELIDTLKSLGLLSSRG